MRKKLNPLNKLKIPPLAIISLAIIYPGIRLLDKWLSPSYVPDSKIDCQILPAEISGLIFIAEIIIMYTWIALIPKINNAVFLMSYGVFSFFSIGSFFFLVTHLILFCPPISPQIFNQYPIYLGMLSLFTLIIFIVHIKPRAIKAVELNKRKINFTDMEFSIQEHPVHIGTKRSTKSISIAAISASLMGLAIARIVGESLGNDYKLAALLLLMMFLSYMLLGYLMLTQLYSTWFVYKKTSRLGQTMRIKEFSK